MTKVTSTERPHSAAKHWFQRRAFVALIGPLTLTAAALAVAQVSAETSQIEIHPTVLNAVSETLGVDPEEARERLEREPAIADLQTRARELYPESFAGLWVDHSEGGRIHLAFRDRPEAALASLRESFGEPAMLVPEQARYSLLDLEELLDRVLAHRDRTGSALGAGIDVARNTVVVRVEAVDSATVSLFESSSIFAGEPIELVAGLGVPSACNSRSDCDPDIRSGLEINRSTGGPCTTAFSAVDLQGFEGQITASHCGFGQWFHQGLMGSTSGLAPNSGRVDAQFIRFESGYNGTPLVYADDTLKDWRIQGIQPVSEAFVGQLVCMGARSGFECGRTTSVSFAPSWVPNGRDFIQTDMCTVGGDSGAGVMGASQARAQGIHSGGSPSCGAGQFTAYGHIQHALSAIGLAIVLF